MCTETSNDCGPLRKEHEVWFRDQSSSSTSGVCKNLTMCVLPSPFFSQQCILLPVEGNLNFHNNNAPMYDCVLGHIIDKYCSFPLYFLVGIEISNTHSCMFFSACRILTSLTSTCMVVNIRHHSICFVVVWGGSTCLQ